MIIKNIFMPERYTEAARVSKMIRCNAEHTNMFQPGDAISLYLKIINISPLHRLDKFPKREYILVKFVDIFGRIYTTILPHYDSNLLDNMIEGSANFYHVNAIFDHNTKTKTSGGYTSKYRSASIRDVDWRNVRIVNTSRRMPSSIENLIVLAAQRGTFSFNGVFAASLNFILKERDSVVPLFALFSTSKTGTEEIKRLSQIVSAGLDYPSYFLTYALTDSISFENFNDLDVQLSQPKEEVLNSWVVRGHVKTMSAFMFMMMYNSSNIILTNSPDVIKATSIISLESGIVFDK